MARTAGILVIVTFLMAALWLVIAKHGPIVLLAFPIVFLVVWAIGAMIYEDWWPFRHL